MKFSYSYRSSDGQVHVGEMSASEREDVFTNLRARGIRPIKVFPVERDSPSRRRLIALVFGIGLGLAVLGSMVFFSNSRRDQSPATWRQENSATANPPIFHREQRRGVESPAVEVKLGPRIAKARARKQISGLPLAPDELCALFNRVFSHPSESWLARFAQPGVFIPDSKDDDIQGVLEDDLVDALEDAIVILPDDSQEIVDVKRIVAGLKEEISLLLTSGKSIPDARKWLEGRQQMESDYRRTILRRVSNGEFQSSDADQLLISMGFAPATR